MSTGMITFLRGVLVDALPTQVVLDVNGVGYLVLIPISSYDKLPRVGGTCQILTHLQVREDAHILYGFMSSDERDLFRLLVHHVSGVGPKLALAVLSGMTVGGFKANVINRDIAALARISGLGKKTAERIIVELKDKVGIAAAWETANSGPSTDEQSLNDAVLALISLGYKQVEAHKALREVRDSQKGESLSTEEFVRKALKLLA